MAAWLSRVRVLGWTRHLSEPRYKLVVLRELVARERARRERALPGKELVLNFLFPGDQPPPRATKQAKRGPRLPDELFSVIARYYWCGEPSAEEEAAAAAERAATAAAAEEAPEQDAE